MRSFYDSSDAQTELMFRLIELLVLLLVIVLYFTVRAVNLVVRVFRKHPYNKPLLITLICFGVAIILTIFTSGYPVFLALTLLCALALPSVAWIVETYIDPLLQKPPEPLIDEVLFQPWWDMEDVKQAA